MGICASKPPTVKTDAETESTCCNDDTCPSTCCVIIIRRGQSETGGIKKD